ncbi:MAG: VOC family protein [Actinobacteria bacterium]|nr:VOC family protein [Actinomycetota bacterium]
MNDLRRVDHVGIVVRATEVALGYFRDVLGLQVTYSEEIPIPHVRLTYLDAGNMFLQLVEPISSDSHIAASLERDGEGFHHLCFGVDDPVTSAQRLSRDGAGPPTIGSGRGRVSVFVPGDDHPYGIRVECTEFSYAEDVTSMAGWRP